MRYTLSLLERELEQIRSLTFSAPGLEGAAFVLCSRSICGDEHRLLGHSVIAVAEEDYLERRGDFLSLDSRCYVKAAKTARQHGLSVLFVHSHPGGYLEFSRQDDREDPKLQAFLESRVPDVIHGSLLLTDDGILGRVWTAGAFVPVERIRVIGRRFKFFDRDQGGDASLAFDRQVRAFGVDIQRTLGALHVGIVGAGGTGSAVAEQLIRLGVGALSVFDGDTLELTNVSRVYGSGVSDAGQNKTDLVVRNAERIGLGTSTVSIPEHINTLESALQLRECDVVFGCTDKEDPRGKLVSLALRYFIPVFDTGVKIDSEHGCIRDVVGRVTTLLPGEACLFCRGRISTDRIRYEGLSEEEREVRVAEGYAPELGAPDPAVVTFTSMVASLAINELLHRLTGFMGEDRESSEILCFFDKLQFKRNRTPRDAKCLCSVESKWGKGDSKLFLDLFWSR